jgi:magnesium chelatase subunit H
MESMLLYICNEFFAKTGLQPAAVETTPATGCLHPLHKGYLATPEAYLKWYEREGAHALLSVECVNILPAAALWC